MVNTFFAPSCKNFSDWFLSVAKIKSILLNKLDVLLKPKFFILVKLLFEIWADAITTGKPKFLEHEIKFGQISDSITIKISGSQKLINRLTHIFLSNG